MASFGFSSGPGGDDNNNGNDNILSEYPPISGPAADRREVPFRLVQALDGVTLDELLSLTEMSPGLFGRIHQTLSTVNVRDQGEPNMAAWFADTFQFRPVLGVDTPQDQRNRFMIYFVQLPREMRNWIELATDAEERTLRIADRRTAWFIRHMLIQLVNSGTNIAQEFVDALRPPPPQPLPSPSPLPTPAPPRPLRRARTTTAVPSSTVSGTYHYCSACGNKHPPGKWNDMNRHWFDEHARSSRSSAELKKKWTTGQMGPWTPVEARRKRKDKEGLGETVEGRGRRREMRKGAEAARKQRATNRAQFERKAQRDDGFADFDPRFVDPKFEGSEEEDEEEDDD